jgi:alanine-synthesizing transaminase
MKDWSFPRAEALPPYGFVITDAVTARVRASGADLIDLGLGNPDPPTPRAIVERLHEAADVGKNHRYHPGRGLLALRQQAAAWYERRYGARFDPDQ